MISSCTGVQNMSSSLSKSGSKPSSSSNEYSRHGDYLKNTGVASRDSASSQSGTYPSGAKKYEPATEPNTTAVYRKDYSKLTDKKPEDSDLVKTATGNSIQDYNQKLINQYAEMDKLGDVVLYEIDIIDRRYAVLLNQYKSASNADREVISGELDKLTANQLTLYKAYTHVYKNGKTDWPGVKNEVETTLFNFRGIDKK